MSLPEGYRPIVDGERAAAIGLLATEWSGAQWFLVYILAELMSGKTLSEDDDLLHVAAIVGMDARPLMGLIKTLSAARLGSAMGDQIGKQLDKMDAAKDLRDLLCHCLWRVDEKTKKLLVYSLKTVGKFKETSREVTVEEIFDKIRLLQDSALALLGYMHSAGYMKHYAPLQGRPY